MPNEAEAKDRAFKTIVFCLVAELTRPLPAHERQAAIDKAKTTSLKAAPDADTEQWIERIFAGIKA